MKAWIVHLKSHGRNCHRNSIDTGRCVNARQSEFNHTDSRNDDRCRTPVEGEQLEAKGERMTLFEIQDAIRNFEYDFDEETGEILNEDEFNELKVAEEAKKEGIACLAKEMRAEAKALKDEAQNLLDRASSKEKNADNLENWLGNILEHQPFETTRCKVGFRRTETCDIVEEGLVPKEYMVTQIKTETKPDKRRIKDDIKSGKEIPGCAVTEHYRIQIK